jgi:hypothetical protein
MRPRRSPIDLPRGVAGITPIAPSRLVRLCWLDRSAEAYSTLIPRILLCERATASLESNIGAVEGNRYYRDDERRGQMDRIFQRTGFVVLAPKGNRSTNWAIWQRGLNHLDGFSP